jgi:dipeptidyl aminopeptidase/acylaminoacyl peptidase
VSASWFWIRFWILVLLAKKPRLLAVILNVLISSPACAAQIVQGAQATNDTLTHDPKGRPIHHQFVNETEFFWAEPKGTGPWPVMIYLHGSQEGEKPGGLAYVKWNVLGDLAEKGTIGVAISEPGSGRSGGVDDFCGPAAQKSTSDVLAYLRKQTFVKKEKIGLFGYSCGSVIASMVATQDHGIAVLLLLAGVYDFKSWYAFAWGAPNADTRAAAAEFKKAGELSEKSFLERSALLSPNKITAKVLILHGGQDDHTPVKQAKDFAAKLDRDGTKEELHVFPEAGHHIPIPERDAVIEEFVKKYL